MKRNAGFTLVELVITVTIVALLASVALPLSELAVQRSREADLRHALREIREAIDAYKRAFDDGRIEKSLDSSGYPPTLEALVQGVKDPRNPEAPKVFFLRRLPRDPMSDEAWGLRAYASPPNEPRAGRDVFDVYSTSRAAGMNGVPYREW